MECTDLERVDEVGTVHSEALRGADHAEEPRSRGLQRNGVSPAFN